MPPIALVPVKVLLIHVSNLMQTEFKEVLRFLQWLYQTHFFYSEQELSFCIPA